MKRGVKQIINANRFRPADKRADQIAKVIPL
jgi:hypothetical protein